MPKCPRGELDFMASVFLAKYPHLTFEEIVALLDCSEGTLRNRKKCPNFAEQWKVDRGGKFKGVRAAGRRRKGRRMPGADGDGG